MFSKKTYLFGALTIFGIATIIVLKGNWLCKEASRTKFKQIETYREVQDLFDSCDEHTLITFDVDDTLIIARDVMANYQFPFWFKVCATFKYPTVFLRGATEQEDHFFSTLFQQSQRFVFDPDIVRLIKQLQQQKCDIVGLTSMESGSVGVIRSMPEWRANMLKDFGIDFSNSFDDVSFTTFPAHRTTYPCLYKGILCTNWQPKGAVLGTLLDHYHLNPARIISFDDSAAALETIAHACAQRNIPFAGYQMVGTKKLYGIWNTRRALLQLDHVMQHDHWLTDEEADAILAGTVHA